MELTPEQVKSLEEALKAYIARQAADGQPQLKDTSSYLTDFSHLKAFTAPLDDETKIKMAYIIGSFSMGDEARAYVDWIKNSTTLRGPALASLFAEERGTSVFEFLNAISKEAYESHARANPLSYIDARARLKESGLDTSFSPEQKDIDAALSRMDPRRYDVHDLKHAKDPALLLKIGTEILDEKRGAMSAERIGSILLREHFDKFTPLPGGQAIINRAIKATAGIDMEDGPAVEPGTIKIDRTEVAFLSRKLAGKVDIDGALLRNLQRDPLAAMIYASETYPKDPKAITAYLSALPRAQELLEDPRHASVMVRMLNILEPSQYAGEPYRLIPEKDVFKVLEKTRPEQLYDIITRSITNTNYDYTYGTYNALLDDMFRKMKSEGKSLSDIAGSSPERQERMRSFLEAAAVYNRMPDIIKGTTPAEHESMARILLHKHEDKQLDLATNAEFIKALHKGSPVLPFIETSLIIRAHEGTEYDKADVGMMAYWYARNSGHTPSADNKGFFDKVSRDESFQVKPLDRIPSATMLDAGKRNFQLHVFYNDQDGIDTFKSFSASMRADGWTTRKQDDFLIMSKERDGRRIEMLISPPESDKESLKKIQDYVAEKGGKISVLIGRGHSHHMGEAVELINQDTKLVTLGGCWGHNYVANVIERSPEAHILSTSGVGRMAINNATTRWLNDQILSGRDLDWKQLQKFWDTLAKDKTLAKDAALYVAPDKNIMLNFERRRSELYEEIGKEEAQPGPQSQLRSSFMQSVRGPAAEPEPGPQPKAREISRAPLQQTAEFSA